MPLVTDPEALSAAINRYRGTIWHTCQLRDFKSYLRLGGVPSRQLLETSGAPFTSFDTDEIDRANGVWDKVFFNLSDFGSGFAFGGPGLPSPYGPIALAFNASVLKPATNVSITLRSAGAAGFDRDAEGIALADLPRMFRPYGFQKYNVKSKAELQAEFPGREVGGNPEVNCAYPNQLAPMAELRFLVVDQYQVRPDKTLASVIGGLLEEVGLKRRIFERNTKPEPKAMYGELWRAIKDGVSTLDELLGYPGINQATRAWVERVRAWDPNSFQFSRWCRYLKTGTIDLCA